MAARIKTKNLHPRAQIQSLVRSAKIAWNKAERMTKLMATMPEVFPNLEAAAKERDEYRGKAKAQMRAVIALVDANPDLDYPITDAQRREVTR